MVQIIRVGKEKDRKEMDKKAWITMQLEKKFDNGAQLKCLFCWPVDIKMEINTLVDICKTHGILHMIHTPDPSGQLLAEDQYKQLDSFSLQLVTILRENNISI
jgi:hypothetical protein